MIDGIGITLSRCLNESAGIFRTCREIGVAGDDDRRLLVGYAIIGIMEAADLAFFQLGGDAFPGVDLQREIDRAVVQRLVGGGAERNGLDLAFAAIVTD